MRASLLALLALFLTHCAPIPTPNPTPSMSDTPTMQAVLVPSLTSTQRPSIPVFGYTYIGADGNHLVDGAGNLPHSTWVDIALDGIPM